MASPPAEQAPLAGWRVLVTRPDDVADALCRRIAAAGARVTHVPLLIIEPLPETAAARALAQDLGRYDVVLVTSRHAVQHALPRLAAYWPQWPAGQQWLAVGASTAVALSGWGIHARAPADARSEGLLALPALADVAGKRILLLTGEGGRGLLDSALAGRGAQIDRFETYRRQPAAGNEAALQAFCAAGSAPRAVLVSSGDALQNLLARAPALCASGTACVAAGERLAALARDAGFANPQVAAGAGDDDMLAALLALARR